MRHNMFVLVASLVLTAGLALPGKAAADDCQQATAKAISTCIKKASKATVNCFKNTGIGCPALDAKLAKALDGVDKTISKKCVNDAAVAAAGYGPLTPTELIDHLRVACAREVDTISARVFGGSDGSFLMGASVADQECLLGTGKEAGKQLGKSLKLIGNCTKKPCDLDQVDEKVSALPGKAASKIDKRCTDLSSLIGQDAASLAAATAEQVASAAASPCDPLDPTHCFFPFVNDYFSAPDGTTPTGRRLAFSAATTPANNVAVRVDPTAWNVLDGFSVGPMLLTDDQQVDLAATGATPITDIATSLDPGAPVMLIDAETLEQQLFWIERDQSGSVPAERGLMMRVGRNLANNHRYIVAMRAMKDGASDPVTAGATFAAYRDRTPTMELPVEARRAHMEEVFGILEAAGLVREDLYLAWDFTTQSTESTAGKMLAMRDDAFDNVLGPDAPSFTVNTVLEPSDDVFRRVDGTFDVPLYLEDGGVPGSRLRLGPDGLPVNEGDFFTAKFRCVIPNEATTGGGAPAIPARPSLYGHGLLGTESQGSASHVRAFAKEHNIILCATQWSGFADEDLSTVFAVLTDFSNFPKFIDRQHQGILNFMALARLLSHPDGFASDAAFQVGGESMIDPAEVFYDGNSQGGILGGALAAVANNVTRFVLGVPGMNYSTLLRRSSDFTPFNLTLEITYANGLDRAVLLSMAQIMWDQTDPNGHINHTTSDTYPGTPPKKILYQVAFGDHQVAPVTVEIMARSNGALIHTPTLAPAKIVPEVTPYYDIPAIPSYPFDGSAVTIWDSGNPAPPIGNQAPAEITPIDPEWAALSACAMDHDSDPHECPRRQPSARLQKSEFLKTGGMVIDTCAGAACLAPLP